MWHRNPFTTRLRLDWPIVLAPMAGVVTPEMAASVGGSGALGSLGFAATPPDAGEQAIDAFRSACNGPINVNFFCHDDPGDVAGTATAMRQRLQSWYDRAGLGDVPAPSVPLPTFGSDHAALIEATRPEVVSFHFGLPGDALLSRVKATGAVLLASATTVAEARALAERGIDAVIAQGLEAGGHRGTFLGADPTAQPGLFALLPQIVDAVDVPVIAAGGISDGRGIAAALMLGASAVQIGTAFLRCPEANCHPAHRAALAAATDDGTRVTHLFSGRPARTLGSRYLDDLADMEGEAAPFPAQFSLHAPLPGSGAFEARDILPLYAGQGAALSREMPAAELVGTLARETDEALARFGG